MKATRSIQNALLSIILISYLGLSVSFSMTKVSPEYHVTGDTVTIGLLIKNNPEGRSIIRTAELAVFQANQASETYKFNLAHRFTDGPWGQGSKMAVELIHDENAAAIIGALDGQTAHLVEQVSAKLQVPYLETKSPDPTLSQAFVPWFFRLSPNADQVAAAIRQDLYSKHNQFTQVAILSDGSYDSEAGVKSFKKQIADVADPMPEFYNLKSEESDYETIANKLKTGGYQAIIVFTSEFNKRLSIPLLESKAIIYEAAPVILLNNRKYHYPVEVINAANNQHEYLQLANFLKLEYDLNPTVYSVFVYDACQLIMRNIDITKGDPMEISKNLSDLTSHIGISGAIYFDDHGNLGRKIKLTQVK